jgi:hypothetical protein
MTKLDTMNLKGNEYAKVPTRLKKFREDCPNGLIKTVPKFLDDGQIMFTAEVFRDQSDPNSAKATGHSLGKNDGNKAFEKLETIAVGRALALLGYLISGEVASSEEMEEFLAHKEEKKQNAVMLAIEALEDAKTIDELRDIYMGLGGLIGEQSVIDAKNRCKRELSAKQKEKVAAK